MKRCSEVRVAVIRAVRHHFEEDIAAFSRLVVELAADSEPSVRKAAEELLADWLV